MNCSQPHETPCDEVLGEVYRYLDAECENDRTSRIKQHLSECHPCLREFGIEQEVKALVSRCCGGDVAPEALRDRLRDKLHTLMEKQPDVTK
ncbi:MAG: mycothiol system anti-sigma-R factor [Corynebacteriales bacterium]|nr:mycothiol system anti-sigma-R factor [Mycobacteriales bacterium]